MNNILKAIININKSKVYYNNFFKDFSNKLILANKIEKL